MMTARAMKVLLSAVLGLALLAAVGAASATLVTWTLQNVRFDDGGTAAGFFVYNTEGHPPDFPNDLLEAFDVKVSGGDISTFPPSHTPAVRFVLIQAVGPLKPSS